MHWDLHFFTTRKGENITFMGPSHSRLTLAAPHPLQEGEKFTRREKIQKAPSVGNSGFQGKGRLDPIHVLREFRKAERMRTGHWWLRSYGMAGSSGWPRSPIECMQHTGISGLLKSKWTLLNQDLHCYEQKHNTNDAFVIYWSVIYLLRLVSTL